MQTQVQSQRTKAVIIAVGTEVTDGQITDLNSGWISRKLVSAGVEVIGHRAVPDEKSEIDRALIDAVASAELVFVTGGLGPTSDDFTRNRIAEVFGLHLVWDEGSWRQIEEKFAKRGISAKEMQKQQCYFPDGAQILSNPVGTANAFVVDIFQAFAGAQKKARLFALPGPPAEIEGVWNLHLSQMLDSLVPEKDRELLVILRCLGKGESDIAEITEEVMRNKGLRIGYRATVPYVEVKIWFPLANKPTALFHISELEKALAPWLVNKGNEDAADVLLNKAIKEPVLLRDSATGGILQERLSRRLRERKLDPENTLLEIRTVLNLRQKSQTHDGSEFSTVINLEVDETRNQWTLRLKSGDGAESALEVAPIHNYKVLSERARKYITEKALVLISESL